MNSETIVIYIVALILGILMENILKNICGCNNIEGHPCYYYQLGKAEYGCGPDHPQFGGSTDEHGASGIYIASQGHRGSACFQEYFKTDENGTVDTCWHQKSPGASGDALNEILDGCTVYHGLTMAYIPDTENSYFSGSGTNNCTDREDWRERGVWKPDCGDSIMHKTADAAKECFNFNQDAWNEYHTTPHNQTCEDCMNDRAAQNQPKTSCCDLTICNNNLNC